MSGSTGARFRSSVLQQILTPSVQFAYHETSFFLVRLLQQFSGFSLAPDAQPADTLPPTSWKTCEGTKGSDKIRLGTHLTMFVKVGCSIRIWYRY
jgi:hypothetical protein